MARNFGFLQFPHDRNHTPLYSATNFNLLILFAHTFIAKIRAINNAITDFTKWNNM